jgi:hypothetical protein
VPLCGACTRLTEPRLQGRNQPSRFTAWRLFVLLQSRCRSCAITRADERVVEWLMAPVLKTGRPKGLVGSNPTPSALRRVISDPPSLKLGRGREVTGEKSALVPLRQRLSFLTCHYSLCQCGARYAHGLKAKLSLQSQNEALNNPTPFAIQILRLTYQSAVCYECARLRHPTFQRIFGRAEEARGAGPSLGLPLYAISRTNWSPESAEMRPLFKTPREDGSWFRAELDSS